MKKVVIAPSILGVAVEETPKLCEELVSLGAGMIHYDVMDGIFVTNKSFSHDDFKYLKERVSDKVIFDVHLMVVDVENEIDAYINLGADYITFHYEAVKEEDIVLLCEKVHKANKKVGISVKPETDINVLHRFLEYVDLVLIMSVEPGAGGQKFDGLVSTKIGYLNHIKREKGFEFEIEIDGGINPYTAKICKEAGADCLVAGSYIINSPDHKIAIDLLK